MKNFLIFPNLFDFILERFTNCRRNSFLNIILRISSFLLRFFLSLINRFKFLRSFFLFYPTIRFTLSVSWWLIFSRQLMNYIFVVSILLSKMTLPNALFFASIYFLKSSLILWIRNFRKVLSHLVFSIVWIVCKILPFCIVRLFKSKRKRDLWRRILSCEIA